MTKNKWPDLTDDEIKKYGMEVLKAYEVSSVSVFNTKEAAEAFCSLIADFARRDGRK
jgi:hypothetical protein